MPLASLGISTSYGTSSAPNGRGWKSPSVLVAHRMSTSYQHVEEIQTESVIVPFTR